MAIAVTMPPTVAEFRNAFPEFASATDAQIQMAIDTGMTWVDTWWFWPDVKLAVLYAAAHYLTLHDRASGGMITGGGGQGGGGGIVDPELGLIWVKTVRFRDRLVTYDRVSASDAASEKTSTKVTTSAGEFWEQTPYGQMLLSYRRRNVPHVAVI
jgi:Protein of unknown function (DUF4054)